MKNVSVFFMCFACVCAVGAADLSDLIIPAPASETVNPDDVMLRRPAARSRADLDARAKAAAAAAEARAKAAAEAEAKAKAEAEAKAKAEAEAKAKEEAAKTRAAAEAEAKARAEAEAKAKEEAAKARAAAEAEAKAKAEAEVKAKLESEIQTLREQVAREKAARENLAAVLPALGHGLETLLSEGSADCAAPATPPRREAPSVDAWLKEAKAAGQLARTGMFLIHNGVVREDARARVRDGDVDVRPVRGMLFSSDPEKVRKAVEETLALPGITYVRVWLNDGRLAVGDDIMLAMVGGDIRPRVVDALQCLVGRLKTECVLEQELY